MPFHTSGETNGAGEPGGHAGAEGSPARKHGMLLLKAGVSAALLYWILRNAELGAVADALRAARWELLVAALLVYTATYYVRAVRWRVLLDAYGVHPSLRFLLNSYFASIFFSNFLPSTIGGDALRGYDSWRAGAGKGAAVAVLLIDRVLGMVVLIAFAFGLLLLFPNLVREIPHLRLWIALFTLGMIIFLLLPFQDRLRMPAWMERARRRLPRAPQRMVQRTIDVFRAYQGRGDVLAKALLHSIVFQAATVLHYWLIARALGLQVPLLAFFVIVPLAIIIMTLPITINAIGLREGVFAFLLASYGVTTEQAVAFSWLAYGVVLLLGVVGGVVYAMRREGRLPRLGGHSATPTAAAKSSAPVATGVGRPDS